MSSFETLSQSEQVARLEQLARKALEHYDILPTELHAIGTDWNTAFRVDTATGERYVMRVSRPHYTKSNARSEFHWMHAIAEQTDIPVPRPILTRDGADLVCQSTPEVPEPRVCLLFSFVEGATIDELTPDDCVAWGDLTARLHVHARTYKPAEPNARGTFRTVLPFPEDRLVIFSDEWNDLVGSRRELFRQAIDEAQSAIDALYANPDNGAPILLHNDLHLWNILRDGDRYTVIDFEDMLWGYPVQDAGVALYYVYGRENFDEILAAYRQGYTQHLPWLASSDEQLDAMIAVREIHMFNVVLQFGIIKDADELARYAERVERRLRESGGAGKYEG